MARRSGSPFTGAGTVFLKELADNLGGWRMLILQWLVLLVGIGAVYVTIRDLGTTLSQDPFLFLHLFSGAPTATSGLPSFVEVLGFLVPLMAICFGFDAVNGEFNRRTLSRVLAQPIYRDALLLGKFGAGIATLAVALITLWLLVVGMGLITMGVPPSTEEVLRSVAFLVLTIFYAGLWLAVAMLCSIIFRSAATSALTALGLWLLASIVWPLIVGFIAQAVYPTDPVIMLLGGGVNPDAISLQITLARISPSTLFAEGVQALLNPTTRFLSLPDPSQIQELQRAVRTPLSLRQSLILIWPQATSLVAGTIVLFVIAYSTFQRQEVRA